MIHRAKRGFLGVIFIDFVKFMNHNNNNCAITYSETQNMLQCPICNKLLANLHRLNQHLDKIHFETTEKQKETVKSWLKKRVDEAKHIASIAVAQNIVNKCESFELNENRMDCDEAKKEMEAMVKSHWQTEVENAVCSVVSCRKHLVVKADRINCRKCGKLFCSLHTLYQIKLSKEARHDPIYGIWSRVCKDCYETRKGYTDTNGPIIDLFSEFKQHRTQAVHKTNLYANRLEKRLLKLINLISNSINEPIANSFFKTIVSFKSQRKILEQTVVSWENDLSVTHCPLCKYPFNYTNRKHHCRLCGRVVCDDLKTKCSSDVQFNIRTKSSLNRLFNDEIANKDSKSSIPHLSISIRICKDCEHVIFFKKKFRSCLLKPYEVVTLYKELSTLRCKIEQLLPDFKNRLDELKKNKEDVDQKSVDVVAQCRKNILELFFQYDKVSKTIFQIPTTLMTVQKLQTSIHLEANRFLQKNLCSLQFLPDFLKKQNSNTNLQGVSVSSNDGRIEELEILEEQRQHVQNWIKEASQRRKYDEVASLLDNFRMLSLEIEKMRIGKG
ncbi:hypothetical protein PORY_002273 [Pneumocystis oryctolagi]|uniref:Uncharacterized protein n=1 Tax=Pneumocystis oryctolagi TaxID=42067 RepID=A0ACB7CBJ4_9ASCO|nr:hypothetical protein PORY_002273 [Pneumocystis oryctolagi]